MTILKKFDIKKYKCLPTPRKYQAEIIPKIVDAFNKKKYVILEAPTGIGKSFIAATLGNYYAEKSTEDLQYGTYILVHQKILQDQYVDEKWSHIDTNSGKISSVYSADNYICHCLKHLGISCAEVAGLRKKDTNICPRDRCTYTMARKEFIDSPLGVTNIQYFMNMASYTKLLMYKKLLVIDEAHNIENAVMNFVSTDISEFLSVQRLKIRMPDYKNDTQMMEWIKSTYQPAVQEKKHQVDQLTSNLIDNQNRTAEEEEDLTKKLQESDFWDKYLSRLNRTIHNWKSDLWVMDLSTTKTGYKILSLKPIVIDEYTHELLFNQAENILMMSATILDKSAFCKNIGINEDSVEFFQLPSIFPPEKRPIYFLPAGSMSKSYIDYTLPVLTKTISHILKQHPKEKGIIHCHTYRIAEYIKRHIDRKDNKRLLVHTSEDREAILQKHISSLEPTILLTPSMSEGVDLKDDLSRFQIICKIPYPFLGDKRVKLKMKLQPWWYSYQTVKLIVQSLGRSVRSVDDYAVSYILDEDFINIYNNNYKLFPDYILEAIDGLPKKMSNL